MTFLLLEIQYNEKIASIIEKAEDVLAEDSYSKLERSSVAEHELNNEFE